MNIQKHWIDGEYGGHIELDISKYKVVIYVESFGGQESGTISVGYANAERLRAALDSFIDNYRKGLKHD